MLRPQLLDLLGDVARPRPCRSRPWPREIAKATTGSPSSAANVRGSAMASVTVPSWSSRTLRPLRQRDHGGGQVFDRLLAGERADRLLAPADLAAAAGQVDVGGPQLPVDVAGGDAEGEQAVGIERDADLALDAADALDLRDALHALQRAHDGVVDEPRQLLGRHGRRARRVGDDRQALDLEALRRSAPRWCAAAPRGCARWRP